MWPGVCILSYLYRFGEQEADGKTTVNIPRQWTATKRRANSNNLLTSLFLILSAHEILHSRRHRFLSLSFFRILRKVAEGRARLGRWKGQRRRQMPGNASRTRAIFPSAAHLHGDRKWCRSLRARSAVIKTQRALVNWRNMRIYPCFFLPRSSCRETRGPGMPWLGWTSKRELKGAR